MATNVISGSDLFVFSGTSQPIAHATSHTLSLSLATWETSDKDSGTWVSRKPGRQDATASCEGMLVYTDFETMVSSFEARTPLSLYFGARESATGDFASSATYASGVFYMTSWEQTAADLAGATYSMSFELASGFDFVSGATPYNY